MEDIDFEGIVEICESDDNSLPSKSSCDICDEERFESIDIISRSVSQNGETIRCINIVIHCYYGSPEIVYPC